MCAIRDVPGKNNNDESNNNATFLTNLFCSSFYQKMEWTKWLQLGVSNTMSNKSYIFCKHIYFSIDIPKMPQMINLTILAT